MDIGVDQPARGPSVGTSCLRCQLRFRLRDPCRDHDRVARREPHHTAYRDTHYATVCAGVLRDYTEHFRREIVLSPPGFYRVVA